MQKYKENSIVKATVTGIENYGVFVSLDDYYSGLIHISEISHDYVSDINKFVKIGETIRVKILEMNDEDFHINLSIKDIDYKLSNQKRKKIKEVGTGFEILEKNLKNWIDEKKTNNLKN